MITIPPTKIPSDFFQFRTTSPTYRSYLESLGLKIVSIGNQFGWIRDIIPGKLQIAKFEKMDDEPSLDALRAAGFVHGLIIWVPWRRTNIPHGWHRLLIPTHFKISGIAILDRDDYWTAWNERARRARKKFIAHTDTSIVRVDRHTFATEYRATKPTFMFRDSLVDYYETIHQLGPSTIRSWLCYEHGEVVAGLAALDFGITSVHLSAFIRPRGKEIQAGTGLIDAWFADSRRRGMRYIDFDHFQESRLSWDQRGYSDFKKNFITHYFTIDGSYFKIR